MCSVEKHGYTQSASLAKDQLSIALASHCGWATLDSSGRFRSSRALSNTLKRSLLFGTDLQK